MANIRSQRRPIAATAVVTAVIAGWGSIAAAGGSGGADPLRQVALTPLQATQAVVSFVSTPSETGDLVVSGPDAGALNTLDLVQGAHISATVDAHDGRIVGAVFLDWTPTFAAIGCDGDEALEAASSFLADHSITTGDANPTVRFVNHGESNEYVVEWQKVVNEIIVPNSTLVGVDAATAKVFRYLDIRRPYLDPGKPRMQERDVIEVALKTSSIAGASVETVHLWLRFDLAGRQYLAWRLQVTGPDPNDATSPVRVYAVIDVNDETGDPVVEARG